MLTKNKKSNYYKIFIDYVEVTNYYDKNGY